jgi:hypothetical protein
MRVLRHGWRPDHRSYDPHRNSTTYDFDFEHDGSVAAGAAIANMEKMKNP